MNRAQDMNSRLETVKARLDDGTVVELRPLGPDDKTLLQEGMARLSSDSRRLRFMAPVDRLSRAQLAYLTEIDHATHIAWGALIDERPVAVGRIVRSGDELTAAELAITVVDDWQRRGLGTLLVRLMAELARSRGIRVFTFEALPENQRIRGLLGLFGAEQKLIDGVVIGTLDLGSI
ncbi:MAG TPA: GNAT family N-acetyltransferase, partial [Aestuariivirgaceae bacterium]|nr:GNAT family N-acetyltransferase [Aestuariivirgaceae bacterium]